MNIEVSLSLLVSLASFIMVVITYISSKQKGKIDEVKELNECFTDLELRVKTLEVKCEYDKDVMHNIDKKLDNILSEIK